MRAELIDNQTFKRAMTVSDYNRGRSVSDLKLKNWAHGASLRSDSLWEDDRYNPVTYPHTHRYDNLNFPDQEYKDIFGGNWGQGVEEERQKYKPGLIDGESKATREHRKNMREAVAEVKKHNGNEEH